MQFAPITSVEALEEVYGPINPNALKKEIGHLTPEYQAWIERAPFMSVATVGPGGLDCSPRGDAVGSLVRITDSKTVLFPDRRGNNRLDTLRNLVVDPRLSLLFLIPGIKECLRINGTAVVTADAELCASFEMDGKLPASVVVITIGSVYFQCGRAIIRSGLWNPATQAAIDEVPTAGAMTKSAFPEFDAETYDAELPGRQASTLY
jgi:uncharacterized protein